jgi:hypothetical protein
VSSSRKEVDSLAKKPTPVNPGKKAPASGQYRPVGGGNEVTVPKGHVMPPSRKPGKSWVMVDPSKNKSGRG